MLSDMPLHTSEVPTFRGPASVELTAMRKQVDVQDSAACVPQEVTFVRNERLIRRCSLDVGVHIWKPTHPT